MRSAPDMWVDGVLRVEIIGDYARTVYWKWQNVKGVMRKVPAERSVLRPMDSFPLAPQFWPGVEVVEITKRYH